MRDQQAGERGALTLYPRAPGPRARTALGDALVALALAGLALLAMAVHDAVAQLAVLGEGVQRAGDQVRDGFEAAASAVEGTPLVGGDVAEGLRGAGEGTGGEVVELGVEGEERAGNAADLAGWATFLVPALLLLAWWAPGRIRLVRRLTSARRALAGADPERRRLIAMRAAFSLPYGQLLRHTRDPLGDLEAGRYEGLVAAELEAIGLGAEELLAPGLHGRR